MEGEGRVSRVKGAGVVSSRRCEAVTRDRQVGSKLVSREVCYEGGLGVARQAGSGEEEVARKTSKVEGAVEVSKGKEVHSFSESGTSQQGG